MQRYINKTGEKVRITSRQLRQIIREELLRENDSLGSAMSYSAQKGEETARRRDNLRLQSELSKINTWFTDVVFPQVQEDLWPVVADKEYGINIESYGMLPAGYYISLPAGTTFNSVDDEKPVTFKHTVTGVSLRRPMTLQEIYEEIEKTALNLPPEFSVPMQSFPI